MIDPGERLTVQSWRWSCCRQSDSCLL